MNPSEQFEAIVSEHYEVLFKFAISLTRSENDAADLTQHTFHVWATKGHQLRDQSRVKPWLFTTLHRAFLSLTNLNANGRSISNVARLESARTAKRCRTGLKSHPVRETARRLLPHNPVTAAV